MIRSKDCDANSSSSLTTRTKHFDDTYNEEGDDDVNVDLSAIVDVDEVAQKPHFLEYDAISPPEFEENFNRALSLRTKPTTDIPTASISTHTGEHLKLDKKFERDGEISDYELAASGYTKKEFTQDDNTLHMTTKPGSVDRVPEQNETINAFEKSKHFLDENPIPPDYMLDYELREHRSLDRNFERHNEYQTVTSPTMERKSSLDRVSRSSREKFKEPFYTLSGFLDNEVETSGISKTFRSAIPKGLAWTESYDRRYDRVQLAAPNSDMKEIGLLGPKVECVYSLLSMLGSNDTLEMSKKFLELSQTPETCATLRRSGCIPLLVQIMNADGEESVRKYASMALHNVVHSHPEEKAGRREAKVLRLLEQLTDYCNFLKTLLQSGGEAIADDSDRHPLAAISSLMKVSFDEEHRHAMCELGALQVIPSLVHLDHAVHGPNPEEQCCNSLRRYALMALTNLTFGDENNKALLCSQKLFMEALVVQLDSAPDDLLQVTASVLRNLSWRADNNMKGVLNEIGTVTALARAAMKNKSENTLKAILSALWNLSAHCSRNKAEFCAVDGALAFLVDMLTYEGPSKTLKIIENAGGILRNVSSHIAVRAHYREILRERNCLAILLQQLKSESLTVVSNACGTLWNLSARCQIDQKYLWDNGAIPMLRSLIHSKHAMISEGSSSALKNLLNFKPSVQNQTQMDHIARSMGLKKLPTLTARKQKALEQELGTKEHSETCDNLDVGPSMSNDCSTFETNINRKHIYSPLGRNVGICSIDNPATPGATTTAHFTRSAVLLKSESRDSVFSTKSDSVYEKFVRLHTESDGNRKAQNITYTVNAKKGVFALERDVEHTEEKPIDYSVQFTENINPTSFKECEDHNISESKVPDSGSSNYATYQETDIDQPTDFSLLYAENQVESDIDISPPDAGISGRVCSVLKASENQVKQVNNGNEILLILEDSVKCYQTEDTPYVISNAASVTDLHQNKAYNTVVENIKTNSVGPTKKNHKLAQPTSVANLGSGVYTPEKPINYCEEGTPGYFSRYESLSSLNESPSQEAKRDSPTQTDMHECKKDSASAIASTRTQYSDPIASLAKDNSNIVPPKASDDSPSNIDINSALETPLMFSRHSSMDSLVDEDVCPGDDKSSVVSDFSRLASGVISPSDIPDSPTQSMPQSPGRNSSMCQISSGTGFPLPASRIGGTRNSTDSKLPSRLRSVFEDDLNTFHVENTPAEFSCATSLSNLNSLEEEISSNPTQKPKEEAIRDITVSTAENIQISEGEEESETNNDDLLLASCINIGMSRTATSPLTKNSSKVTTSPDMPTTSLPPVEVPTEYCTEDTPALLSKFGSNTNLSCISVNSNLGHKDEIIYEMGASGPESENNINFDSRSLNLSDEVSSNVSEAGASTQSLTILQQCIRDGMKKNSSTIKMNTSLANNEKDPVEMMRRGGNILPTYLPVSDEINKFLVEDTPCNFSVVSALSNLTVGSSLVGPAIQIKGSTIEDSASVVETVDSKSQMPHKDNVCVAPCQPDDSLSSLSIDSEDDTNLLSQAIAAGYNRPKSNLGFSSTSTNSKRSPSLSISQPTSINLAHSTSSLMSTAPSRNNCRRTHTKQYYNDSYSSVDSSDSNDNQSKSLFELCILTGMNKRHHSSNNNKKEKLIKNTSRNETKFAASNTHIKTFDVSSTDPFQLPHHHTQSPDTIQLERQRKDAQILMECINTGISKKIGASVVPALENVKSHKSAKQSEVSISCTMSKNAKATSAAVLEPYHQKEVTTFQSANSTAAPDVGMNTDNRTSPNNHRINDITDEQRNLEVELQQTSASVINTNIQTPETDPGNGTDTGCNYSKNLNLQSSINANNKENESFIMETSFGLEEALEVASVAVDKHKDPDLMLKSVERLTQEFVASAEYLRSNSDSNEHHKQVAKHAVPDTVSSNSNNTWNDDTSPNDISFPSVSISVPLVKPFNSRDYNYDREEEVSEADHVELHDFAEITPFKESRPDAIPEIVDVVIEHYQHLQPNSLDTDTETLVTKESEPNREIVETEKITMNNGINFMVGGEVQNTSATHLSQLPSYSMHDSTIMAMEARNLANNFLENYEDCSELTYSVNSLDLDNVRPPSGMESLNISGYYDDPSRVNSTCSQPNSIQRMYKAQSPHLLLKSPKFPRKSLPTGLVARRALGKLPGAYSVSAESVNSSCVLLDNIKPPSLMDELLDSMMSVDSIQSEVVDCDSLETTVTVSNYITAAAGNDFDDNTVTLQSCYDAALSYDKDEDNSINSETLFPSDYEYSSAESTPKNETNSPTGVKQQLTPKQKRKIAKDRFKTYTIVADVGPVDQVEQYRNCTEDENIDVEIEERVLNCQTVLESEESLKFNGITDIISPTRDHCLSNNVSFSGTQITFWNCKQIVPKENVELLLECESNSVEYDQNSETESCNEHESNHEGSLKEFVGNKVNGVENNHAESSNNIRPRISNPQDPDYKKLIISNENIQQAEISCGIRGRKKPAYVSPYRMQYQRNTITRKPSKNAVSTPATVAFRKTNRNSSTNLATKQSQEKISDSPNKVAPLERQGTFVKEEPTTNVSVPVVDSTVEQLTSPSRASKLPTKNYTPSSKIGSLRSSVSRVPTPKFNSPRKAPTPQRSNSNVTSGATRSVALSSRTSVTTPPSRSNSNLNCGISNPSHLSGKIHQARSRIAGIWKSVDEVKKKQQKQLATASSPNFKGASTNLTQKNGSKLSLTRLNKKPLEGSPAEDRATEQENQMSRHLKAQSKPHNESKSTQSKIAINKAKCSVIRKDNISSRK